MGNRTHVTLSVPTPLAPKVRSILEKNDGCDDAYEGAMNNSPFTHFCSYGVNYGVLNCEEELINYEIPFDKRWEPNGNYNAGGMYVRFLNGQLFIQEVFDEDLGVPLDPLLAVLAKNDPNTENDVRRSSLYQELETIILEHKRKTLPIPWSTQMDHVRKLATEFLITS